MKARVPRKLLIDASTMCQLKCPSCSTGTGKNREGVIGWGYLRAEDFESLVNDNPGIREVELSNYGEMFLNPELVEIIRYAHERRVRLEARNGVNLNTVDEEVLEALVKYGFGFLSVSLDGASDGTYGIYRKGGNFSTVIDNVRKINEYKRKYGSSLPEMNWQFVIMGHNEQELPRARRMAGELGMKFTPKLNWNPDFSPIRDPEFVKRESGLGVASVEEFGEERGFSYSMPCDQMWVSPQINWDGRLLGCCRNTYGDYGVNVFEAGLEESLNSPRYVYAKEMLRGKAPVREDMPCVECPVFPEFLESRRNRGRYALRRYLYLAARAKQKVLKRRS